MRFLFLLLMLAAWASPLCARIASVRLDDGVTLTGHVRLTRSGIVVVNAVQNMVVTVPGTNVVRLSFSAQLPAEPPDEAIFGVLPAGWKELDIGIVKVSGSTRHRSGAFTVRGAGGGIGGNYDSFHYVYKPVQGDHEIVARISTVQITHPNAMAGLMMRETMSEYARHVTLAATAERGGEFQVRSADGQSAQSVSQPFIRTGHWVRLRRRGQEFTAFRSANGRQWAQVQQVQIPMGEQYYVGLAVASARDSVINWSTFDRVQAEVRLPSAPFTPIVELTSGTIIVGRPLEVDSGQFLFAGGPRVVKVPTSRVARIIYQPLPSELVWKTRASRPGVWVAGGDFFEGDFQSVEGDQVRLSSVLYGLRTFDVTDNVLAVVLGNGKSVVPSVEVTLVDGSVFFGKSASYDEGEIILSEPALGQIRIPSSQIRDLLMLQPREPSRRFTL